MSDDLVSFLGKMTDSMAESRTIKSTPLNHESCFPCCWTKIHSMAKTAFEELSTIVPRINASISKTSGVQDVQKCLEDFERWCTMTKEFCEGAFAECDGFLEDLSECLANAGKAANGPLGSQVSSETVSCVSLCLKFVAEKLFTSEEKRLVDSDALAEFKNNMDKSYRLSSVMGDDGTFVRRGLNIVDLIVTGNQCFCNPRLRGASGDEVVLDPAEVTAIGKINLQNGGDDADAKAILIKFFEVLPKMQEVDSKELLDQAIAFWTWLVDQSKQFNMIMQAGITHDLKLINIPELAVPDELKLPADLNELVKLAGKVGATFNNKLNKAVVDTTVALEKCMDNIKDTSKSLQVTTDFLCAGFCSDFKALESMWRACLSWMWAS